MIWAGRRWFMPVILTLWETNVRGSFEARNSKPTWAKQRDIISIKKKKFESKSSSNLSTLKEDRVFSKW